MSRGWRRMAGLGVEAMGSLILVLGAFGLFMSILFYLFPAGTPLKELIKAGPEQGTRLLSERKVEGTLVSVRNDVRLRRGNSIVWGAAQPGITLYSQDAVQTFDESEARLSLSRRDQLTLGSNSLVLVDRGREDDERGTRTVRVTVRGDVRGSISGSGRMLLELAAAGRVARIGRKGALFRLSEKGGGVATLAVYNGEAELVAKGRSLRVPADYGVTLGASGGERLFSLPPPPARTGPERSLYTFRQLPPKLRFSWTGGSGRYHFQLAKDSTFQKVLQDLSLDAPEYRTGTLDEGIYFWRVSRLERGAEGRFGEPWRLQLKQRVGEPSLRVEFPPPQLTTDTGTVKGVTDPGIRLFVNGAEQPVAHDGAFAVPLRLKRGVNLIRVEALDEAGNASYASRVVYGKF